MKFTISLWIIIWKNSWNKQKLMQVWVHLPHKANTGSEFLQEGLRIAASKQKGQVPVGHNQYIQMKENLYKCKHEMLPEGNSFYLSPQCYRRQTRNQFLLFKAPLQVSGVCCLSCTFTGLQGRILFSWLNIGSWKSLLHWGRETVHSHHICS